MNNSKETATKNKDKAPVNEIDSIVKRLEELERRCTQLETTLKYTVTFDALAARITGKKTVKRRRVKREWSPEEKKAFHEKMMAAKKVKEKERQQAAEAEIERMTRYVPPGGAHAHYDDETVTYEGFGVR